MVKFSVYLNRHVFRNALRQQTEAQHEKAYHLTCAPDEDAYQHEHPRSLISLCCPHKKSLHPWLSKMRPVNILIRLRFGFAQSNLNLRSTHMSEGTFSDVAAQNESIRMYLDIFVITLRKHAYSDILKIFPPKKKISDKNSDIFNISAPNIDCGYSLEPPHRGGSNEYPQFMFLSRNKKNNVYPCQPQFYYIKVVFKGVRII